MCVSFELACLQPYVVKEHVFLVYFCGQTEVREYILWGEIGCVELLFLWQDTF